MWKLCAQQVTYFWIQAVSFLQLRLLWSSLRPAGKHIYGKARQKGVNFGHFVSVLNFPFYFMHVKYLLIWALAVWSTGLVGTCFSVPECLSEPATTEASFSLQVWWFGDHLWCSVTWFSTVISAYLSNLWTESVLVSSDTHTYKVCEV